MKVPFLDLNRPHQALRAEILAALAETYDGNRFCLGKDVEAFERAFATACGASESVGVSNGTTALHLVARALDLGPGDEIIVPAFTFIASAWTASYVGARPVFADIDPATFCLDPRHVASLITPKTKAIVIVHLFGQAAPMDELLAIASQAKLAVIEDCAQSHLATYRGHPVGLLGDAGTFSFYPTKNLGGCGEGGAIISQRADVLASAKLLRAHGMAVRYRHDQVGYNYRMEGFQGAALGVKLKHLHAWTQRRREIARRYSREITLADCALPSVPEWGESVYHQFTVRHPRRDALREHLTQRGVGTDLIYPIPLHLQPVYADLGYKSGAIPQAEKCARTVVSLPIFPELTEAEIDHVIASVNAF
jgi:dTDP-4-amino-4,6-dideoxygalactose transaminase